MPEPRYVGTGRCRIAALLQSLRDRLARGEGPAAFGKSWRVRVLLAATLLLIVVRLAFPYVLRPIIISRVDAALVGRIELEDLDLSVIRGGVTLYGLAVYSDELPASEPSAPEPTDAEPTDPEPTESAAPDSAPSAAATGDPGDPTGGGDPSRAPLFVARRLWTQLSWLALFSRTIRIEEFELEDYEIYIERTSEGLMLPRPRVDEPAPEPSDDVQEDAPEANEADSGWALVADRIDLRGGSLTFVDHTIDEQVQLALRDLSAEKLGLALRSGELAEPGHLSLQAELSEGSIRIDADLGSHDGSPVVMAEISLEKLPVRDLGPYLSALGWTSLEGSIDAHIVDRFEVAGAHTVSGSLTLNDLDVEVAGLDRPALHWKRLAIDVDAVDLVQQRVALTRIALEGARVPVVIGGAAPLPLLQRATAPPKGIRAASTAPPEEASAAPDQTSVVEERPAAWSFEIGGVRLDDARLELLGPGKPLSVRVQANVDHLTSAASSRWPMQLEIGVGEGRLGVQGALGIAPPVFQGKVSVEDLSLPPLLARLGQPDTALLQSGVLRAGLEIELTPRSDSTDESLADLRVQGSVGLSNLEVKDPSSPKSFEARWKDLDLAIREISATNLLSSPETGSPTQVAVALSRLKLDEPSFRLTHTSQGLVIPRTAAGTPAAGTSPPPPSESTESESTESESTMPGSTEFGATDSGSTGSEPGTEASEPPAGVSTEGGPVEGAPEGGEPDATQPTPGGPAIRLTIDDLRILAASGTIIDRAVEPPYRARIERLDGRGSQIVWPGPKVQDLALQLRGLDGARFDVTGSVNGGDSRVDLSLAGLVLKQFNPYLGATGYSVGAGTLALKSSARIQSSAYDAPVTLVISGLDVGGDVGASRFQQTFGVPLSLALTLLEDLQGNISLSVTVAGDRGGTRVDLLSVVAQSLRSALVGALASPLKLLGAVVREGQVQSLEPGPIVFLPGTTTLAPDGEARVGELERLLTQAPTLKLVLRGEVADADVRVLRERALLALLEKDTGLRGLANLGEIQTRQVVRSYLEAVRDGTKPSPLSDEDRTWLTNQLAALPEPESALEELARARSDVARRTLLQRPQIKEEQVVLGDPVGEPGPEIPSVAVELGAVRDDSPTP